ncbi:Biogenesis of lysosome-related organelles complex 1 subunit 3 [Popillia japonica]|uniref:Biogenesis of lysosome-related organelles complex 1 subunit 3 n=1 Tax=Popillia japonica TaxID=7064 RepID=A0AAW1M7F0_POPJA
MSAKNPVIVSGEASETDSEEEAQIPEVAQEKHVTVHGAVILGEDSESEQEMESRASVEEATPTASNQPRADKTYNSLLHKKLKECNLKLRWDLEAFTQSTINEASKTLETLEKELIQSQLTLQSAISSLQTLNANSNKINRKLHSVVSSSFLSNVKV